MNKIIAQWRQEWNTAGHVMLDPNRVCSKCGLGVFNFIDNKGDCKAYSCEEWREFMKIARRTCTRCHKLKKLEEFPIVQVQPIDWTGKQKAAKPPNSVRLKVCERCKNRSKSHPDHARRTT